MSIKNPPDVNHSNKGLAGSSDGSMSELVTLLGIEFSLADFAENARSGWRKRFQGEGHSLRDWLLLAVPDSVGIEALDKALRKAERKVRNGSLAGVLDLHLSCSEIADVGAETLALGEVASVYFLAELIQAEPRLAWESVLRVAESMQQPIDLADEDPLRFFCSAVEIPLIISAVLRRLERGHALGSEAIITFGVFLERFFDSNGWLAPQYLPQIGPLTVAILRARHLIKLSKHPVPEKIQERFEWIGRQFMRMLKSDGQVALVDGWVGDPELLVKAIQKVTKDPGDSAVAGFILKNGNKPKSERPLPESCDFSGDAQIGVLRSSWRRKSPKIALANVEGGIEVEIGAAWSLFRGDNSPRISIDGEAVEFGTGDFSLNFWESNEDVAVLELERHWQGRLTWQRQWLLSRRGELAIVSDTFLLADSAGLIEYECPFPYAEGTTALSETETREIYLVRDEKIVALAIPLSLGEWKNDRSGNNLLAESDRLLLNQRGRGRGLYSAVAIDFNPQRTKRPRTWRRLTVAEHLQIVNDDVAVAFRLQLGNEQWLAYRSLAPVGNRTFLGQNVYCDFCFGSFSESGDLVKQVEIE